MHEVDYVRVRNERKARATKKVEAAAKAAESAKAKALGKVSTERSAAFDKALSEKRAARAAGWQRSTNLPVEETTAEEQPVETTVVVPADSTPATTPEVKVPKTEAKPKGE